MPNSVSLSGFSSEKVLMLSCIWARFVMPLSTIVGCGTVWSQRNAHAGVLSSGRAARMAASVSSSSFASLPPLTGSMTQTGSP